MFKSKQRMSLSLLMHLPVLFRPIPPKSSSRPKAALFAAAVERPPHLPLLLLVFDLRTIDHAVLRQVQKHGRHPLHSVISVAKMLACHQ